MRKALQGAVVEKDVENAYREGIRKARPQAEITSPYKTDGFAKWDKVRLLLEAKFDLPLKDRVPVCNTLGQCLLYMKRFEQSGEPLPNVILVGDKNECFVLSTACVQNFLNLPIDWTAAPSSGNPDLTRALVSGLNILPYVYDVDANFNFKDVIAKIEVLADGAVHSVRAMPGNIGSIFVYWRDRVFGSGSLTAVEQVDVFLRCLFQPTNVYLHPTKRGLLVVPGYPDGVPVSAEQYKSFFDQFQQGYKPSEIESFYAMKDRLVEDDARRRQGAFFTPVLWVNEAHKMVEAELGDGWRDECIVWDPAAGTGNLTRDYAFRDLILSTAEKPDIEVIRSQGYNPGAEVFTYDFLNPGTDSPFFEDRNVLPDRVDAKLKAAAKSGKRLVFLMNPPYGTANDAGAKGTSKQGIALTSVNADMKQSKIGASSQQLYAQFMFRCARLAADYGFKHNTVALFSVPTFMCSGSYRKFREFWYKQFEYKTGMLFQASHFADVSSRWGISFTLWSEGRTCLSADLSIVLKDVQGFAVEATGVKSLYSADDQEASEWVRQEIKGIKGVDAPTFSSGLKLGVSSGNLIPDSLGYLCNAGNSFQFSGSGVSLFSGCYSNEHGLSILPTNFLKVCALYAARKLVTETWNNQKDEYLAPTVECEASEAYKAWNADAVVYALLHGSNNCTAMRDVQYKGKQWRIKNNFWWKTLAESKALYDTASTPALYADLRGETTDSHLATILPSLRPLLSPEATECLRLADGLLALSLPLREDYAAGKPELHLTTHDAGLYQLKHIFRDLFPTEWKAFQSALNRLADKMRPGVYDLGWLKK